MRIINGNGQNKNTEDISNSINIICKGIIIKTKFIYKEKSIIYIDECRAAGRESKKNLKTWSLTKKSWTCILTSDKCIHKIIAYFFKWRTNYHFFQSVCKKKNTLMNYKKILNMKCINKKLPFVEYNWSVSLAGKMTDF